MKKQKIKEGQIVTFTCKKHGFHTGEVSYRENGRIIIDIPGSWLVENIAMVWALFLMISLPGFPLLFYLFKQDPGYGLVAWVASTLASMFVIPFILKDSDYSATLDEIIRIDKQPEPEIKEIKKNLKFI